MKWSQIRPPGVGGAFSIPSRPSRAHTRTTQEENGPLESVCCGLDQLVGLNSEPHPVSTWMTGCSGGSTGARTDPCSTFALEARKP